MRQYTESEVLKALRERLDGPRGKTQAEIARELGFSPQFLSAVVGEQRPITKQLARALGFYEQPRTFIRVK
jgi:plasmid maintenance system antidote protein VapI